MKVINDQLLVNKETNKIFEYFDQFDYLPTIDEIHQFYPKKISKSTVGEYYKKNQKSPARNASQSDAGGKIKSQNFQKEREKRKLISERKIKIINSYIKILSKFPQVKLIGLSGTVAMNNAKENDDIDLFIITAKNRLFTGRLIAILLAQLLNLRRKRNNNNVIASESPLKRGERGNLVTNKTIYINGITSSSRSGTSGLPRNDITVRNKICLNLFFDESSLIVPKFKQTEYVAHEVLQMRPLINKDKIYERFLKANAWVFEMFPNAFPVIPRIRQLAETRDLDEAKIDSSLTLGMTNKNIIIHLLAVGFELITKCFQLTLINRHRTSEIITDTQLWFFPEDYEKRIQNQKLSSRVPLSGTWRSRYQ